MNILLWVLQVILGLAFIMFGSMKVFQYEKAKVNMPSLKNSSKSLVIFIGIVEILGGLGLIIPYATGILPMLTSLAAIGLAIVMLLAAILHLKRKENQSIMINIIFFALALFVAIGRF